jgi:hypothetical protein
MNIAHPHKKIYMTVLLLASISVAILSLIYFQSTTKAADLSKFDPGNIMSDDVMSNHTTMSVQQIQAFLESKNACNNTNTYLASYYPHLQYNIKDGKFVCMAKESFSGESAAQIIWQAGKDYGVNPQVLIVLLQKEQGLVTDTWPNHKQYAAATGYNCPDDDAGCRTNGSGFKSQVRGAAMLFSEVLQNKDLDGDRFITNYPTGNNYVQYNPSTSCGGSQINIQNRATSALYRYTPYQPNQSSLAAGYGTGDSCGAYGNRNFWLWFNDWFGSTQTSISKPLTSKATDTLTTGNTLKPGEFISSADGSYMLIMQYSGQLVLYRSGQSIWQSGAINWDQQGGYFILQGDGNMVIYKDGSATWSSATDGKSGTKLVLQNDGNLVLYTTANQAAWSSGTSEKRTSQKYLGSTLSPLTRMVAGDYLRSSDWRYYLRMQGDGNFVLYTVGNVHALWSSGTDTKGGKYAIMQGDGNFVIYGDKGAVWSSGTDKKGAARVVLQSDGNVVIYSTTTKALWSSGTDTKGGKTAIMQGDGNFVIYGDKGAVWSSGTDTRGGKYIVMQADGNLVIYSSTRAVWASDTAELSSTATECSNGDILRGGGALNRGESICSTDKASQLIMQNDGNLVLYNTYTTATWSSATDSKFVKSDLRL